MRFFVKIGERPPVWLRPKGDALITVAFADSECYIDGVSSLRVACCASLVMTHLRRAIVFFALGVCPLLAAPPTLTPDWSYDVLKLKNGVVHQGMIVEENAKGVRFRIVRRAPGRPTVSLTCVFTKNEIDKLDKLTTEARADLKAKLEECEPSAQAEAKRLEKLDLKPIEWRGKKDAGRRYDSDYFSLLSDAPEEIVRRAAYRLEQVYAAYARYLPSRFPAGKPVVIHVYQSLEGYQTALPKGMEFRNPAFYDPDANRVVCGTDLQRLGEDLDRFRQQAAQQLAELKKQEEEIRRLFKVAEDLNRHLKPIRESQAKIRQVAHDNEKVFDRATEQLFRILYHEAFHAYVGNFVYPPTKGNGTGDLPRWLNEGMAQVFETAIFEAGELRVGHAERERLEKAQDWLAKKEFTPLKSLLNAGPKVFVVAHGGQRPETDRVYVAAWAVASYLMFDRRLLGTPAIDEFVKGIHKGDDVVKAFEKLTGQPLEDFEKAFHHWLRRLRTDGSVLEILSDR